MDEIWKFILKKQQSKFIHPFFLPFLNNLFKLYADLCFNWNKRVACSVERFFLESCNPFLMFFLSQEGNQVWNYPRARLHAPLIRGLFPASRLPFCLSESLEHTHTHRQQSQRCAREGTKVMRHESGAYRCPHAYSHKADVPHVNEENRNRREYWFIIKYKQ